MRDFQRQRVYDAENASGVGTTHHQSVAEVQAYVDKVVGSVWWRRRSSIQHIEVLDGRRRGRACAEHDWRYGEVVKLPRWSRYEMTILHELAHHLAGLRAEHRAEFAGAMMALVRQFLGAVAAEALREQYTKRRVRWRGHQPKIRRSAVRWVACEGCHKRFDERKGWALQGWSFCTRTCGLTWAKTHLRRALVGG